MLSFELLSSISRRIFDHSRSAHHTVNNDAPTDFLNILLAASRWSARSPSSSWEPSAGTSPPWVDLWYCRCRSSCCGMCETYCGSWRYRSNPGFQYWPMSLHYILSLRPIGTIPPPPRGLIDSPLSKQWVTRVVALSHFIEEFPLFSKVSQASKFQLYFFIINNIHIYITRWMPMPRSIHLFTSH